MSSVKSVVSFPIRGIGDKPQIAQMTQTAEAEELTADGQKYSAGTKGHGNDRGLASSNLCHL